MDFKINPPQQILLGGQPPEYYRTMLQQGQPSAFTIGYVPYGNIQSQYRIGGPSQVMTFSTVSPEERQAEAARKQQMEEQMRRAEELQTEIALRGLESQKSELDKQRAREQEIASGQFKISGRPVSREEMERYQENLRRSSAQALQAIDPFYVQAKQALAQRFPGDQQVPEADREKFFQDEYSRLLNAERGKREQAFRSSLEQFQRNPMAYILGSAIQPMEGSDLPATMSPAEFLGVLSQAQQMSQATGFNGDIMSQLLGFGVQGKAPLLGFGTGPAQIRSQYLF